MLFRWTAGSNDSQDEYQSIGFLKNLHSSSFGRLVWLWIEDTFALDPACAVFKPDSTDCETLFQWSLSKDKAVSRSIIHFRIAPAISQLAPTSSWICESLRIHSRTPSYKLLSNEDLPSYVDLKNLSFFGLIDSPLVRDSLASVVILLVNVRWLSRIVIFFFFFFNCCSAQPRLTALISFTSKIFPGLNSQVSAPANMKDDFRTLIPQNSHNSLDNRFLRMNRLSTWETETLDTTSSMCEVKNTQSNNVTLQLRIPKNMQGRVMQ